MGVSVAKQRQHLAQCWHIAHMLNLSNICTCKQPFHRHVTCANIAKEGLRLEWCKLQVEVPNANSIGAKILQGLHDSDYAGRRMSRLDKPCLALWLPHRILGW